jgi:hypothetical protein
MRGQKARQAGGSGGRAKAIIVSWVGRTGFLLV